MPSHHDHKKKTSGKKSHTHKPSSSSPTGSLDPLADAYKRLKAGKPVVAAGHAEHHKMPLESMRKFEHNGHQIIIRTQYEISVDGKPLSGHVYVDNGGKVSTHALPAYSFPSAVDLVKKLIDDFPDNFITKASGEKRKIGEKK